MALKGRGHQIVLVASFLAVIFTVPLAQAVIELRQGESPQVLDLFRRVPSKRNLRLYENDLESQSWFAKTLRPWMQYARFVALRDAGEKAVVGRDGWWFYRPGVRYLIDMAKDDPKRKTGPDQAVAAIVSFRNQLAERGIHLLVVPVPGKASVYPDKLTRRAEKGHPSVRAHTRRFIAELVAAGVEVVDPFAALAGVRARSWGDLKPGQQAPWVYMPQDTHWTRWGVSAAAWAVAQHIRERGWVGKGPVKYGIKGAIVRRHGDVVRMLRCPPIERLYPPKEFHCEQVIRQDTGKPYQDDPNSPILVLGDSFLRIYECDEPGSAGFIAHLARGLRRPLASIVNDGGASTLVRQELARKPELLIGKKLVVWEFVERDIRFGWGGWQDVRLPDVPATTSSRTTSESSP